MKPWSLKLGRWSFYRLETGSLKVTITLAKVERQVATYTPAEVRRLYQKLSGDYRD